MARRMIYVIGQPSGGTSCVAGVLHYLGVDMGDFDRQPNVHGYVSFEDQSVKRYCHPTKPASLRHSVIESERCDFEGYIEARRVMANGRPFGYKGSPLHWLGFDPSALDIDLLLVDRDPRVSAWGHVSKWAEILGEQGRLKDFGPEERLLNARSVFACYAASMILWSEAPETQRKCTVTFDDLRKYKRRVIARIAKAFRLRPTREEFEDAVAFVQDG